MNGMEAIDHLEKLYCLRQINAQKGEELFNDLMAITEGIKAIKREDADGCTGCEFECVEEWEPPCDRCRRSCKDYWREKGQPGLKRGRDLNHDPRCRCCIFYDGDDYCETCSREHLCCED